MKRRSDLCIDTYDLEQYRSMKRPKYNSLLKKVVMRYIPHFKDDNGKQIEDESCIVRWIQYGEHPLMENLVLGPKRSRSCFDYLTNEQLDAIIYTFKVLHSHRS